jgi:hypothetical protein
MDELLRRAVREATTYVLIAVDLALGFFTWLLITGLIPGDAVNFNVVGSLVMISICTLPWIALDRYVQKRINGTA